RDAVMENGAGMVAGVVEQGLIHVMSSNSEKPSNEMSNVQTWTLRSEFNQTVWCDRRSLHHGSLSRRCHRSRQGQ
ncbi:MAG: hypothetical protein KDE20_23410, partial [Caldilineaceae bacterium]|nr:hypothetical protein [Caldilineaceae bacterium]